MEIIQHRINTLSQYKTVPRHYGIELDVRYHEDELVLHHDPFCHHTDPQPEKFTSILEYWQNTGPMILNVKSEGVEQRCIELMKTYNISNWFFLDLSMPFFARLSYEAYHDKIPGLSPANLAVRFSEREALEYALHFSGKAKWVWVDCFTKLPLKKENAALLKAAGFKLCLVAPELQHHPLTQTQVFQQQLQENNISIDAVCTKHPALWENYENSIS